MTTHTPDPQPQPYGSSAETPHRPAKPAGPRTGPIIWGVIVLAFCGYVTQRLFGGVGIDGSWWIIATVIGLGVLLLGIGLTVALRDRGR